MSNVLRIGNCSFNYEEAKGMLLPELIPQKGNEAMLTTTPHEKVEDMAVVFRLDQSSRGSNRRPGMGKGIWNDEVYEGRIHADDALQY